MTWKYADCVIFNFFEKNLKKPSCRLYNVELEKLEILIIKIHDQISLCESVGVKNRLQRDQFSQYFLSDFEPKDSVQPVGAH